MVEGHSYLRAHRKAVFVLVVFVVAGGTWLLVHSHYQRQKAADRGGFTIADSATREEQLKKLQQDSDNDGLRDWEEALYHTDPHNPDTDGDGTPDGEEVKLGRDPLKPNTSKNPAEPNDLMATSTPEIVSAGSTQSENLTKRLAEEVGKQIIVQRIAHPDIPFDPQSAGQDLVDRFADSVPDEVPLVLTEKDIVIGHDTSTSAVKIYVNGLQRAIGTNFKGLGAQLTIYIFEDTLNTGDYSKLTALDSYLAAYARTIDQLKKLTVPPQFVHLHAQYLNLAIAQQDAVKKMREAETDPVGALVGAKQYIAIWQQRKTLLDAFTSEYQKISQKR